jgi:hypothetical protein
MKSDFIQRIHEHALKLSSDAETQDRVVNSTGLDSIRWIHVQPATHCTLTLYFKLRFTIERRTRNQQLGLRFKMLGELRTYLVLVLFDL